MSYLNSPTVASQCPVQTCNTTKKLHMRAHTRHTSHETHDTRLPRRRLLPTVLFVFHLASENGLRALAVSVCVAHQPHAGITTVVACAGQHLGGGNGVLGTLWREAPSDFGAGLVLVLVLLVPSRGKHPPDGLTVEAVLRHQLAHVRLQVEIGC
eukprot:scaffold63029_cov72-Phaeocystis_antarctica.AAC.5